jgi:hypothetical protein
MATILSEFVSTSSVFLQSTATPPHPLAGLESSLSRWSEHPNWDGDHPAYEIYMTIASVQTRSKCCGLQLDAEGREEPRKFPCCYSLLGWYRVWVEHLTLLAYDWVCVRQVWCWGRL